MDEGWGEFNAGAKGGDKLVSRNGDWRVEISPRASHRHVTKPVSRVLYRALHGSAVMTIHLVRLSPSASCDQPGRLVWKRDWRF